MNTQSRQHKHEQTRQLALKAVLQRRKGVSCEPRVDGLTLLIPKKSFLLRRVRMHRVELDNLGGLIWQAADGETSVSEIIERLSERTELSFEAAEGAFFEFLRQMTGRNLLLLMVQKTEALEPEPRKEP